MLTIRDETPADEAAVRRVNGEAFPTDAEARLVDTLRDAGGHVVSLVAVADDRNVGDMIVGHILFTPVALVPRGPGGGGVGLAPMAVLPAHQRRGIGSRLVEQGLAVCRERR